MRAEQLAVEMALERFCRPPGAAIEERTAQHKSRYGIVGARMTGPGTKLGRWLKPWRNHMGAGEIRARSFLLLNEGVSAYTAGRYDEARAILVPARATLLANFDEGHARVVRADEQLARLDR